MRTVLLHLRSGWPIHLKLCLLFLELDHGLLVGVFQDHQSFLLMLELGGEVVGFSLEARDLALVHGSAHSGLVGVTLIHFEFVFDLKLFEI